MEQVEQSRRLTDRRSFLLKGAAVGAGAIGASRLLTAPPVSASGRRLTKGDVAILQFLAAAELLEADLWEQYNELGGIQDSERPGGNGNKAYTRALSVLDKDIPQYIHDNADDERSHASFINAYLAANGADPINLDKFRTVPSSKATGARQIGRLTNLMELTIDTSWWTRYRSDSKNPDLGDSLPQAVPDLAVGKHPAIPRSDDDLTPRKHLQAIANTAGFHFGTIEQGGTSLYASLAQRVTNPEVLRILLSIGPTETMHFQTWQDKAGNAPPLTDPTTGLTFPDLNAGRAAVQAQPDHARANELPRSEVPEVLDHPPHQHRGRCPRRGEVPDRHGAVQRTVTRFLRGRQGAGGGCGRRAAPLTSLAARVRRGGPLRRVPSSLAVRRQGAIAMRYGAIAHRA